MTRVLENFQGVTLNRAELEVLFEQELPADAQLILRLSYSPASFQVGLFGSVIGAALLLFLPGVWLWRLYTGRNVSDVARVARNSVAPILLHLFNRGIDFAFALVMLRILGPEDAGVYFYAGFIFLWFDILTNFGLDVWLTREVARDPTRALRVLISSSALRLGLTLAGLLLLAAFLLARQQFITPPLGEPGLLAILLLYLGLFPGQPRQGPDLALLRLPARRIPGGGHHPGHAQQDRAGPARATGGHGGGRPGGGQHPHQPADAGAAGPGRATPAAWPGGGAPRRGPAAAHDRRQLAAAGQPLPGDHLLPGRRAHH